MKFRMESGGSLSAWLTSAAIFLSSICHGQGCLMVAHNQKSDVTCFGAGNGKATITLSGGMAPYTYSGGLSLRTSNEISVFNGLSPGVYSFTVTDATGCRVNAMVDISEPPALQVSGLLARAGNDRPNGSISASVSGGRSPYAFLWNIGAQTQNLVDLGAGTYALTVTDANGCSVMLMEVIPSISNVVSPSSSSGPGTDPGTVLHAYLYPNPSNGLVHVQIGSEEKGSAAVDLVDMSGRVIKTMTIDLEKGINATTLQLPVHTGIYALRIKTGKGYRTLPVRID